MKACYLIVFDGFNLEKKRIIKLMGCVNYQFSYLISKMSLICNQKEEY